MLELKPSWLTQGGQIKSTDTWMRKHIENAHLPNELSLLKIDCTDAPDEPEPDELYARHYSYKFPWVYRVKDLEWHTPVTRDPRAILLIAKPIETSWLEYVIFRLDKLGLVCAHAHGIAVTRPLLDFAERTLPKLEDLVAAELERRAKSKLQLKEIRAAIRKGKDHPSYRDLVARGVIIEYK